MAHRSLARYLAFIPCVLLGGTAVAQPATRGDLPAVTAVRAGAAGVARSLRYTGTVTAERDAALSARQAGLVAAVRVDAGDRVRRGDLLLQLDPVLAELDLARARASLEEARTRRTEQARLRDDAAALAATSNISRTQARTAAAEADIAAAAVTRLEAEVRRAAELVARHRLEAPFDGVVRRRLVDVGEWVQTGTPAVELVSVAPLRLDVQVPQERYALIRPGQAVTVELDALRGTTFPGKVLARVAASNAATRTFLVRVLIEKPGERVIPGMSGQVELRLPAGEAAVTVPEDAVVRGADGVTRVWLVTPGAAGTGRVSARVVALGPAQDGRVEVQGGVPAGSLVVVRGNETLREGQDVRLLAGN